MLVFDFFAGTRSATKAFNDFGHQVISFDNDASFDVTEQVNILELEPEDLVNKYGRPQFVWASPPCTAFSVASIGRHWYEPNRPKSQAALESMKLVSHTRRLLETLNPRYGFLIENPRGMLRKLSILDGLERRTVTYCQYGEERMKPTDLWGTVKNWVARKPCSNGGGCHVAAPRGSRTGTQGIKSVKDRARVPYALGQEILQSIEGDK